MTLLDPRQSREPLAYRMAPRTLEEYVGQAHILSEGMLLRRMVEADRLSSIILWGPPGTGKTSLARIVARQTSAEFTRLNAVTAGVKDLRRVIEDTLNPLLNPEGKTVLFIDEIHRFNKAQQDALLPQVEDGTIVLIGATTENPYFEVNKALVSRSTVFQLTPLTEEDILKILRMAVEDEERGLGGLPLEFADQTLEFIANFSNGDARIALNGIELAALTTPPNKDGKIRLTIDIMKDSMQERSIAYDGDGEEHYDNISALIKSMRGSDPDAAIFYLARALHGGEDIEYLARRIVICAAEDVGMANPQAMSIAMSAYQTAERVGMPEARIPLALACVMVATSPKSNAAYLAIDRAMADVRSKRTGNVPLHLRNAPIEAMAKDHEYSVGYKYAHDYPGHIVKQQYLPDEMLGTVYYEPTENGYEKRIYDWLEKIREAWGED